MSRKAGIILSAILSAIIGLWLWAGIIPKGSTSIGGSTSVDPVMQRLTNTYKKHFDGDSFIYSSSGSTGGVNNAKSGTYKIGFISRALDGASDYVTTEFNKDVNTDYKTFGDTIYNYLITPDKYSGDQMHYVQIATDAIIVTYNAPKWFKDNYSKYFNINMDGNQVPVRWQTLIQNIYSGTYKWSDVVKYMRDNTPSGEEQPSLKYIDASDDHQIVPFAREPGSGTRNSFDHEFGFDTITDKQPSRATEYNSNGMMYNDFSENTFGYMSMNYLKQIQNNENLETVLVNHINPSDANSFKISEVGDTYKLTRPYIGLIKWNLPDKEMRKIANFLAWIATAQKDQDSTKDNAYAQFVKSGLKPEFKLDDKSIPGASTNVKPVVEKAIVNTTKESLLRTILNGYLIRH